MKPIELWHGEDHPHAYGDKTLDSTVICMMPGSSPRVWGQEFCRGVKVADKGIIPTRMGTRFNDFIKSFAYWDHPHAYGDKLISTLDSKRSPGSSPRVWGQDNKKLDVNNGVRIIPTRMGTSLSLYLVKKH